jgi:hypothetical protein
MGGLHLCVLFFYKKDFNFLRPYGRKKQHFKTKTNRFDLKQFFICERVVNKQHFKTKTNRFDFKQFFICERVVKNNTLKPKLIVSILNNFLFARGS